MPRHPCRWSLLLLALALGCRPAPQPSAAPATSATVGKAEIVPGEHLLFLPEGDPSSLLGREVSRGSGHWVIAPERKPGCTVSERRVDNDFSRRYESDLSDVAMMQASVQGVVELEGRFERRAFLRLDVHNAHVLRADLGGNCGARAITEVEVGTGERTVLHTTAGGGEARVDLGAAGGGAAQGGRNRAETEALAWDQPQAWAFRLGDGNGGDNAVEILMPESLVAEQPFTARIRVEQPLWLVVLYRDAEGHHGVLLPRGRHLRPFTAGEEVPLPAMIPSTLPGHTEDRETLLVYGFTEEADFQQFRPPAGAIDVAQADAYATTLEERLRGGEIPRRRWTSTAFTYLVRAEP